MSTAHVVPTSPTAAAPPTPTPSFSVEESKHTRSQVHAFQMQIKQTPGDFPTFKEDKGWFQWHRLTIAIAAAQGVSEPLDKDYYPEPDTDEELLFKEKQTYLYSVFVLKIQTSFGKASVRRYANTSDAQAVYRELYAYYNLGVAAEINAQVMETELMAMKLDDKYRKGCENFLNSWTTKLMDLENIRPNPVPDNQKKIWLTSALQPHPLMQAAITQASTLELTMAGLGELV